MNRYNLEGAYDFKKRLKEKDDEIDRLNNEIYRYRMGGAYATNPQTTFDNKNMTNSIKTINTNKINENEIENGINSETNRNNNSNIEEEIEVTQLTNKLYKNIIINMNEILDEIKHQVVNREFSC